MSFVLSSRRRHRRFKCDWSSDVCSSDLMIRRPPRSTLFLDVPHQPFLVLHPLKVTDGDAAGIGEDIREHDDSSAGKNLDRKSVVEGKRGDLGGRRII